MTSQITYNSTICSPIFEFFKLTAKKTSEFRTPLLTLWFEYTCDRWIPLTKGQRVFFLCYNGIMLYHPTHIYPISLFVLYTAGLRIFKFSFPAQTHQYSLDNMIIGHGLWRCKHIGPFWYYCIKHDLIDCHGVTCSTSITFSSTMPSIINESFGSEIAQQKYFANFSM